MDIGYIFKILLSEESLMHIPNAQNLEERIDTSKNVFKTYRFHNFN